RLLRRRCHGPRCRCANDKRDELAPPHLPSPRSELASYGSNRQTGARLDRVPPVMSALGHKRTLAHVRSMSALPPKADIGNSHDRKSRFSKLLRFGCMPKIFWHSRPPPAHSRVFLNCWVQLTRGTRSRRRTAVLKFCLHHAACFGLSKPD